VPDGYGLISITPCLVLRHPAAGRGAVLLERKVNEDQWILPAGFGVV
jgi:hypothetical protein